MVHIEHALEPDQVKLIVSLDELRVLVHHLAPEDSFLRDRATNLLPEAHEEIAEDLSEQLRRFHDRRMNRTS